MTAKNCTSKRRGVQLIAKVGCNSKGKHKSFENGKHTKAYSVWRDMLRRCYDPNFQAKHPTYIGCTVDERWHDYQDFAEWHYNHDYSHEGFELDKDLLILDNKNYSPETCCFVPRELNVLLTNNGTTRGEYPQGVCWHKKDKKYQATMCANGKTRYLGSFDCPQKAHQAYVLAKEFHVKKKALEWKYRIEDRVFNALMAWRVVS